VLAANQQFHFGIYRAARSELLLSMIENLWDQSGPYIAAVTQISLRSGDKAPSDMVIAHHYEALAALGNRDAAASRAAVATDILHSASWYRASIFFPGGSAKGESTEASLATD
jgi:DNA-binding GntR family transcriptional regulator